VNIRYVPEALAEYEAAAVWYDDHSTGAGDEFADAIERAELLIAEMPRTWPRWPGVRTGVRRYLIPGLLYAIAYEIVSDEIVILGVAHHGVLVQSQEHVGCVVSPRGKPS
jgi:plasmid stabilization system protein ParE